jgi:hypothetical protein
LQRWRLISSERMFHSEYITIFNDTIVLPDKSTIEYKRVKLQDFCSVLPLIEDKKNRDD